METIDANHNGILDASELRYFDIHQNGTLDDAALSGIQTFETILARQLVHEYSKNGGEKLNRDEFNAMASEKIEPFFPGAGIAIQMLDRDHDGMIAPDELSVLMRRITTVQILNELGRDKAPPTRGLKELIDAYWRMTPNNPAAK